MASDLDNDTLQRYFDGELSPVEERTVRARVEADPEAQAELAQMARLGELMQTAAEEMGGELDSDALFARVEAGIQKQEAAGFGERFQVITSEWVEHKKGVVVPILGATAVAAAALLTVSAPGGTGRDPELASQGTPVAGTEPGAPTPPPEVHGSEVEDVDFGANTGTVFTVDSQGIATAVVWIADDADEEEQEDRP